MSNTTYFFPLESEPPKPRIDPLDRVALMDRAVEKMVGGLVRSFCPVCEIFVGDTEVHLTDGRVCHKLVNITIP